VQSSPVSPNAIRFGLFEADLSAGELRKRGRKIPLQDQPFRVLALLLLRPGELVSREEFQRALWPGDTFVEFDEGLNKAIQKLRQALDDSSDNPRFIETLPRKGYRFIAPVERTDGEASAAKAQPVPVDGSAVSSPAVGPVKHRSTEFLAWVLFGVVSVALVVLSVTYFRQQPADVQPVRFLVARPDGVALGTFAEPVISPDGRQFVFSARNNADGKTHLWIRSLDSTAMRLLAGTEEASFPFWSPDSRNIAFFSQGKLKRMNVSGGPAQVLGDSPEFLATGAWNRDGSILFVARGPSLARVNADGGEVQPVRTLDQSRHETEQGWPQFLPDGRHFLYYSSSSDAGKSGIFVGSLDSKETRLVVPTLSNVSYSPAGFLVYGRQNTLVAQAFDLKSLRVTGPAFPIAEPVASAPFLPGLNFSVSQNGVLVYCGAGSDTVQLNWYDRDGKRSRSIGESGQYGAIVLSPDEGRLALERLDPSQATNLWILDLASGIFSRQTFHQFSDVDPRWSPNGRELVFAWDPKSIHDLYRKVVGGGEEELLFESGEPKYPKYWLKDGKSILIINQNGRTLYQLPLTGERKPVVLTKSGFTRDNFLLSPDERWVAYNSNESGRWEVYAAAFPTFTEKRQVSSAGGCQPMWRKDGKELFYLTLDGKLMAAEVKSGTALQTGTPQMLFQSPARVSAINTEYCVTADGKRFLFRDPVGVNATPFTVVVNWTAALKR